MLPNLANGQETRCDNYLDSCLDVGEELLFQNTDKARIFLLEALELAKTCNRPEVAMRATNCLGVCDYIKGNYDAATRHYFDALKTSEQLELLVDEGVVCNNLGALYFDIQQLDESAKFYERAMRIMTAENDTVWRSKIAGNLAGVYFMREEYDRAIDALHLSIELGLQSNRLEAVGGARSNLAMVYRTLGQNDRAVETIASGIQLLDSIGDRRGVCIAMNELANLYYEVSDYAMAETTYQQSLARATEIGHKESIKTACKGLATVEQALGHPEKALEYYVAYSNWKDSLLSDEKQATIEQLKAEYQSGQQAQEIALLKAQSEVKDLQLTRQNGERNFFLALIALAIAVVVLVVVQLRSKQRINQSLEEKNSAVEKALADREMLIREIHHRVKNNLQIISSILNIQAHASEHEAVTEALLESRSRIQSMSVVHEQLYKTAELGKINIQDYVSTLLEQIEIALDPSDADIDMHWNIEPVQLDIDTAIPLGLVISELVNNAYKHAFTDASAGKISVELAAVGNNCALKVRDNGTGSELANESAADSFGIRLINTLVGSLNGELVWSQTNGTTATITFAKP